MPNPRISSPSPECAPPNPEPGATPGRALERRETADGLQLYRYGEGPRVFVGFHGWGAEHTKSFRSLLERLPEDVTFWAMDMPGCGASAAPPRWDWEVVTEILARGCDQIAPERQLSLVGSCSGSFHALAVALERPARVERMLLLEPFAYMPWFFSIFLAPVGGRALYRVIFDNPIGQAATRASLRRQKVSSEYDMVGAFARGSDLGVAYRYLQFYGEIPEHTVFAAAPGPVRIILGERSWKAIHEAVDLWRENWPELEVVELAGTGHMFSQEAPERTIRAIFTGEEGVPEKL